jgi:uncharacterized protein YceK
MALNKALVGFGALLVGTAGVLGVTNPSPEQYADFAGQKAVNYLETEVCTTACPLWEIPFRMSALKRCSLPIP